MQQLEDKKVWNNVYRGSRVAQLVHNGLDTLLCSHRQSDEDRIDFPSFSQSEHIIDAPHKWRESFCDL